MGQAAGSSPTTQGNSAQTSPMLANQDAARAAQSYFAANPTQSMAAQSAGKGLAFRTPVSPTGGYFQGSNGVQAPFGGIQLNSWPNNTAGQAPVTSPQPQQPAQPMQPQQPQSGMRSIYGQPFFQNWNNTQRASPQDAMTPPGMQGIQVALRQPRYTAQNPYSITNLPLFNGQLGRMLYI